MTDTTDDRLPFTCLVPDAAGIIDIFDQTAALHIAVVDRAAVQALPEVWDGSGCYILLDPPSEGAWGCYVGKAPAGLRARLLAHLRGKDHWSRALLIRRDTTHGFQSGHTGWLEGRLHDLMVASANGQPSNKTRPADDTLPPYDQQMLETTIDPISRVLRLIGYDPAAEGDEPMTTSRKTKAYHGKKVADLISAGLLAPGAKLVSTAAMYPAEASVEADGSILWRGQRFTSPSTAGAAVKGKGTTNGWEFWAVETDNGKVTLATLRSQLG